MYALLLIVADQTDLETLLDIIVVCLCTTPVWLCHYFGGYTRVKARIKAERLEARRKSIWRPYFKKDGYYGSASDKTIWE